MKILITGIAGFVGANLAERLLGLGHTVLGIDDFSRGKIENISHLKQNPFLRVISGDVATREIHDNDIDDFSPDTIVHLASKKIPRYSNSFQTIDNNHKMIFNVCEWAQRHKAHLLFTSTSDVYGKNMTAPFTEESPLVMGNTDVKRWAYAVSKMHSEHYIIACHDKFGLDYTIMRFFTCYGEHQAGGWWGGAQSIFIDNVLDGKEIEIHGSGMQIRSLAYIADMIDGVMLCIENNNAKNKIFNIGNPFSVTTIYGLVKLIFALADKIVPIKNIPYSNLGKYEDSVIKIPDISRIAELGFAPKWNLYDGLKKTIEWKIKSQ